MFFINAKWVSVLTVVASATLGGCSACAETFRCVLPHVISAGDNGIFQDNKNANTDTEIFLAIDPESQKGTLNLCLKSGCTNVGAISVFKRSGKDDDFVKSIFLISEGAEIWSLEDHGNSGDFYAATASVSGLSSQSRFGRCKKIIQ